MSFTHAAANAGGTTAAGGLVREARARFARQQTIYRCDGRSYSAPVLPVDPGDEVEISAGLPRQRSKTLPCPDAPTSPRGLRYFAEAAAAAGPAVSGAPLERDEPALGQLADWQPLVGECRVALEPFAVQLALHDVEDKGAHLQWAGECFTLGPWNRGKSKSQHRLGAGHLPLDICEDVATVDALIGYACALLPVSSHLRRGRSDGFAGTRITRSNDLRPTAALLGGLLRLLWIPKKRKAEHRRIAWDLDNALRTLGRLTLQQNSVGRHHGWFCGDSDPARRLRLAVGRATAVRAWLENVSTRYAERCAAVFPPSQTLPARRETVITPDLEHEAWCYGDIAPEAGAVGPATGRAVFHMGRTETWGGFPCIGRPRVASDADLKQSLLDFLSQPTALERGATHASDVHGGLIGPAAKKRLQAERRRRSAQQPPRAILEVPFVSSWSRCLLRTLAPSFWSSVEARRQTLVDFHAHWLQRPATSIAVKDASSAALNKEMSGQPVPDQKAALQAVTKRIVAPTLFEREHSLLRWVCGKRQYPRRGSAAVLDAVLYQTLAQIQLWEGTVMGLRKSADRVALNTPEHARHNHLVQAVAMDLAAAQAFAREQRRAIFAELGCDLDAPLPE